MKHNDVHDGIDGIVDHKDVQFMILFLWLATSDTPIFKTRHWVDPTFYTKHGPFSNSENMMIHTWI